jgi:drug/metabolite transporter (DMT)-like permease
MSRNRTLGLVLMTGAGLAWSSGGLLVRSLSFNDGWEIVFWRSLFLIPCLAVTVMAFHRGRLVQPVLAVGRSGLIAGLLLAVQFFCFLLAITRTTVAETLVLMSVSPFMAALTGWALLGERVPARTLIAMAIGFSGIAVMFAGSLGSGALLGNLIALGVPLAFAGQLVALRQQSESIDMLPTVLIAGLVSLPLSFVLAWPLEATPRDLIFLAIMGAFQLALGCALMTIAVRHLPAAEIGLFALLETILGPIWVWIVYAERPTDLALFGAVVVIGALTANALFGLRRGTTAPP